MSLSLRRACDTTRHGTTTAAPGFSTSSVTQKGLLTSKSTTNSPTTSLSAYVVPPPSATQELHNCRAMQRRQWPKPLALFGLPVVMFVHVSGVLEVPLENCSDSVTWFT